MDVAMAQCKYDMICVQWIDIPSLEKKKDKKKMD